MYDSDHPGPAPVFVLPEELRLQGFVSSVPELFRGPLTAGGSPADPIELLAAVKGFAHAIDFCILVELLEPATGHGATSFKCLVPDFEFYANEDGSGLTILATDRRMTPEASFSRRIELDGSWSYRVFMNGDGQFEVRLVGPALSIVLYVLPRHHPDLPTRSKG